MDLLELWVLARRNWLIILLTTVFGVTTGWYLSSNDRPLYSATSSGVVVYSDWVAPTPKALTDRISGYLPLVRSRAVTTSVADTLGIPSMGSVGGSLNARAEGGGVFRVTATAYTAEMAANMADVALMAISSRANEMETLTMSGQTSGKTLLRIVPVEPALLGSVVSGHGRRNIFLGFVVGLLGGLGLVVLRKSLDRRVRLTSDVQALTGSSVLAVVPYAEELAAATTLASSWGFAAEAMRKLRTNLRFIKVDNPPRSIVVTSCNASEGKSTIATHLASMLAESGKTTILIDADLRRPVQAERFDVDGAVGLTEVIIGSVSIDDALIPTDQRNLLLLPAGRVPPNPTELVGSGRMHSLVSALSQRCMVVIDAPPLLPVADGALLAAAADGALLVVHSGKTHFEQLRLGAHGLEDVNASLLGVIMNRVSRKDLGYVHYGYGYGSSHYAYPAKRSSTNES